MIRDVAVKSIISNIRFFKILVVRKKKKNCPFLETLEFFTIFAIPPFYRFNPDVQSW